jgi:hypothetical protein
MVARTPLSMSQGFAPAGALTGLKATGNVSALSTVTSGRSGGLKIEKSRERDQLGKENSSQGKVGKVLHELRKAKRKRMKAKKAGAKRMSNGASEMIKRKKRLLWLRKKIMKSCCTSNRRRNEG